MTTPKLSHSLTDAKGEAIGRMYSRVPGGTPEVPSITTVIDALNPHMEWWRGRCAALEGIRLAELIAKRKQEGIQDPSAWRSKERQMIDHLSETSVRDMDLAARRGDVVHDYAEKLCRVRMGEPFDIPTERAEALNQLTTMMTQAKMDASSAEGYLVAAESFLKDYKVEPVTAEATVWNSEVGYAGTNDLLCRIDGRLTLLDWKTKKELKDPSSRWYRMSIKPTIALQLEAARHGEQMYDEVNNEWIEWSGRDAVEQVGVALAPNGYEAVRVKQTPDTWETFKALVTAWHWYMGDKRGINPHLPDSVMSMDNPWG